MNEIKSYLTENECYKSDRKMTEVRGLLIHDTATPGATPETFVKSWNVLRPAGKQVCVHAFADDTKVINTLPYTMRCWGCGFGTKGSGNDYYIQIEMCDSKEIYFKNGWEYNTKDKDKTYKYVNDTAEVVSDWAAKRLNELGFNSVTKDNVTSHYEANAKGIASNHGDPKGFLSLGGLDMDKLRGMISVKLYKLLNGTNDTNSEKDKQIKIGDTVKLKDDAVQWDKKTIPNNYKAKEYKVKQIDNNGRTVLTINDTVMYAVSINYLVQTDTVNDKNDTNTSLDKSYLIKVTTAELNIRSGPGTAYSVVGSIKDQGVYTIVETNGTWGKLKNGAGWISLNYTRKV